jgi:diguanylate cyclase (GGDEF)-like protein
LSPRRRDRVHQPLQLLHAPLDPGRQDVDVGAAVVAVLTGAGFRVRSVTLTARALRTALVAGMVAGLVTALGAEGFWVCVPAALVLAAAEPGTRGALIAAGLVIAVAALTAPPPLLPAAVVAPASVGVLLGLRSRLERERDAMRRFALRDPLTGLANRRALDDRLGYEIARHSRHAESFAVLALDLDGFKAVNDRFGHDAGDEVLRDAAGALMEAVRAQDTVVRLGGDEFCVLAPQTDREAAAVLAARVLDSLAGVTAGLTGLSASLGTAVFPADGSRPDALLAAADAAARQAKRRSGSRRALRSAA